MLLRLGSCTSGLQLFNKGISSPYVAHIDRMSFPDLMLALLQLFQYAYSLTHVIEEAGSQIIRRSCGIISTGLGTNTITVPSMRRTSSCCLSRGEENDCKTAMKSHPR